MEELFAVWDERYYKTHGPLHRRVRELCERFLRCGDLHFGFLRLRCTNPDCTRKDEKFLPFSCKTRGFCCSCAQRRALGWAERMVEEVLPVVDYRQLVFTIPRRLRKFFLFDRALYGDLCRAAYASTRDYLRRLAPRGFPRLKKAVPAMIASPQSFGDLLLPHPHCHALVSLGLFSPEGVFCRMEDVDFSGLEELFRERFFKIMVRRGKITPEIVEDMQRWPHSGFNVNSDRKIQPQDRKELEGLLCYMERAPVSLRRLNYRPDGRVHYQGTRVHPRLGIDHQLLSPLDFLALLIPHVLLRYEVTIRTYGALSTTFRKKVGWIEDHPVKEPPPESMAASQSLRGPGPAVPALLPADPQVPTTATSAAVEEEDDEFQRKRRRNWAKLISKVWLEDPQVCHRCGKPMAIVAAITSPGQDDVIEKVLRHLQIWDPPWQCQRAPKARAPPQPLEFDDAAPPSEPEFIDPPVDDELYFVDPPAGDDWLG